MWKLQVLNLRFCKALKGPYNTLKDLRDLCRAYMPYFFFPEGAAHYKTCLEKYKQHPEVIASSGIPDENDARSGGSGSISLPPKMEFAVKRWIEECDPEARAVVSSSNNDVPFNMGCFGEKWALDEMMFLGSKVKLLSDAHSNMVPLDGEAYVTIDWNLPLLATGQAMLYKRAYIQFKKLTSCIPISQKKKYRANDNEKLTLRNIMALFDQLRAFMKAQMEGAEFDQYVLDMSSGSARDEDFVLILGARPEKVSTSMLNSVSAGATKSRLEKEKSSMVDVEEQRLQVRAAKYNLWVGGLDRDQEKMVFISQLPREVKLLQHKKNVFARSEQTDNSQKATKGYCTKYLRTIYVSKMELLQSHVQSMKSQIAPWATIQRLTIQFSSFRPLKSRPLKALRAFNGL